MAVNSNIEWCDSTWNPTTGCTMAKGSETGGCLNCYAARLALRRPQSGLAVMRDSGPRWTGKIEFSETRLLDPLHWRTPRRIFVNSMSDLFHESLPDRVIDRVFAVMALCPQHTFQVLTKRPDRMLAWASRKFLRGDIRVQINEMEDRREAAPGYCELARRLIDRQWPLPHVWMGASVEHQAAADLRRIPLGQIAHSGWTTFVSYEPALAPVNWDNGWLFLKWLIVGGESGPCARPLNLRYVYNALEWCRRRGVVPFVKQLGAKPGTPSCASFECTHPDCGVDWLKLRDPKGGDPREWPKALRVREFPEAASCC